MEFIGYCFKCLEWNLFFAHVGFMSLKWKGESMEMHLCAHFTQTVQNAQQYIKLDIADQFRSTCFWMPISWNLWVTAAALHSSVVFTVMGEAAYFAFPDCVKMVMWTKHVYIWYYLCVQLYLTADTFLSTPPGPLWQHRHWGSPRTKRRSGQWVSKSHMQQAHLKIDNYIWLIVFPGWPRVLWEIWSSRATRRKRTWRHKGPTGTTWTSW